MATGTARELASQEAPGGAWRLPVEGSGCGGGRRGGSELGRPWRWGSHREETREGHEQREEKQKEEGDRKGRAREEKSREKGRRSSAGSGELRLGSIGGAAR